MHIKTTILSLKNSSPNYDELPASSVNFMDKRDIIYKYQFGFRKPYSTQNAIITLVDKITS